MIFDGGPRAAASSRGQHPVTYEQDLSRVKTMPRGNQEASLYFPQPVVFDVVASDEERGGP